MKVRIKRSFCDREEAAEVDVSQIDNCRWDNISGGYGKRHAGYALYGYIPYEEAAKLVNCSGRHEDYGYQVKIMIPKSWNREDPYKEGYRHLIQHAGIKPKFRKDGQIPCTKRIILIVGNEGVVKRKQLREQLISEGYPKMQIAGALKCMKQDGRLILTGSPNSPYQLIKIGKLP